MRVTIIGPAGAVPIPTYYYVGIMAAVPFSTIYVRGKVLEIVFVGGQSANTLVVPSGTFTEDTFDDVVYPIPPPTNVRRVKVG